jgi:hypothetical protein
MMKKLETMLVLILAFGHQACADFAPFPLRLGEIRESRQNAIILFDQGRNSRL